MPLAQHLAEPPLLVSEPILEALAPGSCVWALLNSECRAPCHRAPALPPRWGACTQNVLVSVGHRGPTRMKPGPGPSALRRKDTETQRQTGLKPRLTPEFAPRALLQTAYMSISPCGLFIMWIHFTYHIIPLFVWGQNSLCAPGPSSLSPERDSVLPTGLPPLPSTPGRVSVPPEAVSDGKVLGRGKYPISGPLRQSRILLGTPGVFKTFLMKKKGRNDKHSGRCLTSFFLTRGWR